LAKTLSYALWLLSHSVAWLQVFPEKKPEARELKKSGNKTFRFDLLPNGNSEFFSKLLTGKRMKTT